MVYASLNHVDAALDFHFKQWPNKQSLFCSRFDLKLNETGYVEKIYSLFRFSFEQTFAQTYDAKYVVES